MAHEYPIKMMILKKKTALNCIKNIKIQIVQFNWRVDVGFNHRIQGVFKQRI
jgi:hypothetical protein